MKKLLAVVLMAALALSTGVTALASPTGASGELKAILGHVDGGQALRGLPAQVEHAGYDAQAYIESLHPQQGPVIAAYSPSAAMLYPPAGGGPIDIDESTMWVHLMFTGRSIKTNDMGISFSCEVSPGWQHETILHISTDLTKNFFSVYIHPSVARFATHIPAATKEITLSLKSNVEGLGTIILDQVTKTVPDY